MPYMSPSDAAAQTGLTIWPATAAGQAALPQHRCFTRQLLAKGQGWTDEAHRRRIASSEVACHGSAVGRGEHERLSVCDRVVQGCELQGLVADSQAGLQVTHLPSLCWKIPSLGHAQSEAPVTLCTGTTRPCSCASIHLTGFCLLNAIGLLSSSRADQLGRHMASMMRCQACRTSTACTD